MVTSRPTASLPGLGPSSPTSQLCDLNSLQLLTLSCNMGTLTVPNSWAVTRRVEGVIRCKVLRTAPHPQLGQ